MTRSVGPSPIFAPNICGIQERPIENADEADDILSCKPEIGKCPRRPRGGVALSVRLNYSLSHGFVENGGIICAFRPSNDGKSGAKMMDWEHGWRLNAIRKSSLSTFGNLVSKSLWKSRLPGMHIIRMTSSWSPGWAIFYEQCDVSPSTNTSWIPSDFPLLHKGIFLRIQRSCFRRCQCQWLAQEWEGILFFDPKRLIHTPRFVTFSGCFVQHC